MRSRKKNDELSIPYQPTACGRRSSDGFRHSRFLAADKPYRIFPALRSCKECGACERAPRGILQAIYGKEFGGKFDSGVP